MGYRISAQARLDLEGIWLYLAKESEDIADQAIDNIFERFPKLAQFPEMGRDRSEIYAGLRSFPVQRHIIFYNLIEGGIEVVRILHGARDIDTLFP
jgi:toxin ParE1/3/4